MLPFYLYGADLPDYYQKGRAEIENGQPEQAVAVWLQGWAELNLAGETDPRLAFALIESVTEQGMVQLYQQASHIYLWGFEEAQPGRWKDVYAQEIRRLESLTDEQTFRRWQQLLEENDPALMEQIRLFWDSLDPIPAADYNPRIAEHWERIAYARRYFDLNDLTVYGTDERGLVHVKYGSPDLIFVDTFRASPAPMLQFVRQQFIDRREYARALANAVEQRAMEIIRERPFVVWVYQFQDREVVFYFGQPGGTGSFRKLDSILDLLPTSYNRYTTYYDFTIGRIRFNAGPFLVFSAVYQASMYDMDYQSELASFYSDMEFGDKQEPGRVEALRYQAEMSTVRKQQRAAIQYSWLDRNLERLPLTVQIWRFLDQNQEPYMVSALFTELPSDYYEEPAGEKELVLRNTWRFSTDDGLICRETGAQHIGDEELALSESLDYTVTTLLNCPFEPETGRYVYSAELYDLLNAEPEIHFLAPDFIHSLQGLRARGRHETRPAEPLSDDLNSFLVSDIVLGIPAREAGYGFGDIRLIKDNTLPIGSNLALFFEVYNLQENESGMQEYTLEYEIKPVRTRLQRILGTGREDRELSILLTLETSDLWSSDQLEVELAGLNAREYEIVMTFTDNQSGKTIERTRRFTLVEREN